MGYSRNTFSLPFLIPQDDTNQYPKETDVLSLPGCTHEETITRPRLQAVGHPKEYYDEDKTPTNPRWQWVGLLDQLCAIHFIYK